MRLFLLIFLLLVFAFVVIAPGSEAREQRTTLAAQHWKSTSVIRFLSNHSWMRATRHDRCTVPWKRTCIKARELHRFHSRRLDAIFRTIPDTDNWTRAMRYAQRVFPNTLDWLTFISNRECRACYTVPGGFVCNYQGSGACGPMQFMSGTFYGYSGAARAAVARRGFIVDPSVWDWRNPLGQALTAAYMRFYGKDGCHWCL